MGGIQLGKLLHQYAHRPTIGDDVVQGQHQHMVIKIQLQQADAQQRAVLQIERSGDFLLDFLHRQFEALGLGPAAQVVLLDGERCERGQGLQHLAVILDKSAAQALMPLQQDIETLLQRRDIQRPL
ncbi:hypothetical protein D9M71_671650 [compost metagenome]